VFFGHDRRATTSVRGFYLWFADPSGFYFHTGSTKQVALQLKENPRVEICFYNAGAKPSDGRTLRVSGEAEIIRDSAMEEKLMNERPFLKAIKAARKDVALVMFRVVKGEAHFWTMAVNLNEDKIPRVRF